MALPPLLKRRAKQAGDIEPGSDAAEALARTKARRRLIGAAVLLVAGVIAFPLLFETQPRPIPVDIPMVIPSRDNAAPLVVPPKGSRSASGSVTDAATAVAAAPAPTPAPAPAPAPAPKAIQPAPAAEKAPERPAEKPADKAPAAKAEPKTDAKTPAKAEPRPDTKADTKAGRWVVQVGAYADEAATREIRQRVEKLGLKTYTQAVDVNGAKRIRVRIGPFESQDEASKALARLKAGNLPGAVLTL